jgi:zinc transport system substrate-binding protein
MKKNLQIVTKQAGTGFFFSVLLLVLTTGAAFAGGNKESVPAGNTLSVFVSIQPQKYFVERIGGDLVETNVLVKPGQSPHSFEPAPSQVTALGNADIYFTIGVDFEKSFLPEIRSALPKLEIIESNRGIAYRETVSHIHGDELKNNMGTDPHIWLSPQNGKIIAGNIKKSLIAQLPEQKIVFETNYSSLIQDIDALDKELQQVFAPLKGETFLVFHPSFGYFADEYGLVQEAIETGGSEPTPKQLEAIISEARAENIQVIFVQPQFAKQSAQTVAAAIEGAVVPIDPLAADWLGNLRQIGEQVRNGLRE